MGGSILGVRGGGKRTVPGEARLAAWRRGASSILALIMTMALLSALIWAPAKVAATVIAAWTQGGW